MIHDISDIDIQLPLKKRVMSAFTKYKIDCAKLAIFNIMHINNHVIC